MLTVSWNLYVLRTLGNAKTDGMFFEIPGFSLSFKLVGSQIDSIFISS
jgi:hypothetical protein